MTRRRATLLTLIPAVLLAGLAARFMLAGPAADVAGGVLYTALVYVLFALVSPRRPPLQLGAAAFAFSAVVECFQATGIPADLAEWWSPIRLALGTSFVATDLLSYAVGALLAAELDRRVRKSS